MFTIRKFCFPILLLILPHSLIAQSYPEMTGLWKGHIRIVTSPNLSSDELVAGGVIISEADLELTISAQDGEVFIGSSWLSTMVRGAEPIHVYGSIRSTGGEGIFIDSLGGHGQLWLEDSNNFEYCYSSLGTDSIVSYCAKLQKE
jgi:hypothetical protein